MALLSTPVNAAFSTSTTGGTLAAGTYWYRVSALDAQGETLASTETSQVTTGTTSTVTVNWGAVAGATGYKIYGRSAGAELFMAQVGAVTTWTDTGAVTPSGALPAANTTGTSYPSTYEEKKQAAYVWFANAVAAEDPGVTNHAKRLAIARQMASINNLPIFATYIDVDFKTQLYDDATPLATIQGRLSALATNLVILGFGN